MLLTLASLILWRMKPVLANRHEIPILFIHRCRVVILVELERIKAVSKSKYVNFKEYIPYKLWVVGLAKAKIENLSPPWFYIHDLGLNLL